MKRNTFSCKWFMTSTLLLFIKLYLAQVMMMLHQQPTAQRQQVLKKTMKSKFVECAKIHWRLLDTVV